MFLRNMWYVAAFSADLSPGKCLGRRYLNEPVVLFRTASGQVSALADRCSHRAMPLSEGRYLMPERPGLGIEPDLDALAPLRVAH